MRKRISIFIIIFSLIFLLNFNVNAEESYDFEFMSIGGKKDLDSNLLYDIKYLPLDISDNINMKLIFDYELSDSYDFKSNLEIIYEIKDSLGHELIAKVGNDIIFDLVLDDKAYLYKLDSFDFSLYTDNYLHIESFKYYSNYLFDSLDLLALSFNDKIKLDFLEYNKYRKGKEINIDISLDNLLDIEDIYLKIRNKNNIIKDHYVLETNYYKSNDINEGNYYIKFLTIDYYGNELIDKAYINLINGTIYNHTDLINVDYNNPLSDEVIINNYVHFNGEIRNYKIKSDYKFMYNKVGTYDYYVIIEDENFMSYTLKNKIIVSDYSKPILNIEILNELNGDKLDYNDLFDVYAYDEIDGNLSSNVKIDDLDNYNENYKNPGKFRFLFYVADNNLNEEIKLIELEYKIEIKEIIEEEEKEELPNIPKFDFVIDTNQKLTRALFRQKLIFNGFYNENDNLSIISDYFSNTENVGSYLVYVKNNKDIDCYSITVNLPKLENNPTYVIEDDNTYFQPILIFSILGIGIVSIIIFLIIKKVKKI